MKKAKICRDLTKLHPEVQERALNVLQDCGEAGLNVDIFETLRTLERQKWLKSNGYSKTLNSYHMLGLAVDFVFKTEKGNWTWRVSKDKWNQLAEIIENNGFYSLWKHHGWDGPHGELRIKGVRSTTLHKELREVDYNLQDFWEMSIDPRLPHDAIKAVLETFTMEEWEEEVLTESEEAIKVEPAPEEDKEPVIKVELVTPEKPKPKPVPDRPVAPESLELGTHTPSSFSVFIQFILGLFGGRK